MKKEPAARQNTPLAILILVIVPLYGGYHNTFTFAAGAALGCVLLYEILHEGTVLLPVGPDAWCLYGIAACMFLTIPFAVSPGMAFIGGLRSLVWILFFLVAAAYTWQERQIILDVTAYEGAALALLSILDYLYGRIAGLVNLNGRMDGLFQYANTWALYLLCCLVLLFLREKQKKTDWIAISILLCGILLTGSRGVFLILFFLALAWGIGQIFRRRRVKPVLVAAGVFMAIGGLTVALSGGMVLQRLQATTFSSVTLTGRLLYYVDGLRMLQAHPLGVGHGGYLYVQATEQTGIYTTHHIHNEYLQSALDGGVLCGLLMIGFVLALLLKRGAAPRERVVCFVVCVHACIDFDFQFTAVMLLLLLCGSGGKSRPVQFSKRTPVAIACGLLVVLFSYFSVTYYLDFMNHPTAAYAMFPADLSLAENRLQDYQGAEEAEPLADKILQTTDLSMVAWDCKYTAASQREDWGAMVDSKYHYLKLCRYTGEEYEDFLDLLEQACLKCSQEELSKYLNLAEEVNKQLEEVIETTSSIAYRITDDPVAFAAGIQERLQKIIDRKELM